MNTVDLTGIVEEQEMPVCPVCGQPIWATEYVALATVDNLICLIHYYCGDIEFFNA